MPSVNLLDEDLSLWNEFRNGNTRAFGELIRAHYSDLFHYGRRFTRNEDLVKRCIQDLFLALWTQRSAVAGTCFVKHYLLKALRSSLTRAIGRYRPYSHLGEAHFEQLFDGAPPVASELRGEEHLAGLAKRMCKTLTALTRRQQEIVYLRFYMEADTDEIADIMSLNRQSIENLLGDALRKLRKVEPAKTTSKPGTSYGSR